MSSASNLATAEKAAAGGFAAQNSGDPARQVAGRSFVRRGDVWTDAAHRDSVHVITVAPYTPAYFALVRALPEIGPCLRLGEAVLVGGKRESIKVAAGGLSEWRPGQLQQVVSSFRGT